MCISGMDRSNGIPDNALALEFKSLLYPCDLMLMSSSSLRDSSALEFSSVCAGLNGVLLPVLPGYCLPVLCSLTSKVASVYLVASLIHASVQCSFPVLVFYMAEVEILNSDQQILHAFIMSYTVIDMHVVTLIN